MVFSKLSVQEKDAFFGLLDEYFQSRPELLAQPRDGGQGAIGMSISPAAAASVVQRALAASNAAGPNTSGPSLKSNNPYGSTPTTGQPHLNEAHIAQAMNVGRVAAASLAFSQGGPGLGLRGGSAPAPASGSGAGDAPPTLPRRFTSNTPTSPAQPPGPGAEIDKLVTRKTNVFSAFKKQSAVGGVALPSAFGAPRNEYGPPPVRRAASETGAGAGVGAASTPTPTPAGGVAPRSGTVPPRAPPRQELEPEGEWAEVLYDYSSEDPGDLAIEAGTRVLVTDKSSEDWWSGQVEGQGRGLFPASYVKLL